MALLYLDLDNFKYVNDRRGHNVGDALLSSVAERIQTVLQTDQPTTNAVFARLAGDEFAIAMPPNLSPRLMRSKAEQILALFAHGFHLGNDSFPVTASIGIANYPGDGISVSQLVNNADVAMYQAKADGKNRFYIYSADLAVSTRRRFDIELALKSIRFDKEFHLVYMPICDENRRVRSCEALLRWKSPTLGDVSPAEFVPIAENSGMYRKLDFWVIENALRDFDRLETIFGEEFTLSINLSSAELESTEIVEYLEAKTRDYGLDPARIELELTETFAVDEGLMSVELLNHLVKRGFQIAIDDFGTGHTSLLQLIQYPVHKIKFDREFVQTLLASSRSDLLEPLIALCHAQGFFVTAEGIENEFIARFFCAAGCDFLQGYYYSKPKTLAELEFEYQPLQVKARYQVATFIH
jgi:diguanylate cyclase (GGDEF)-like protein